MTFTWSKPPERYSLSNSAHCAWLAMELTRKLAEDGFGLEDRKLVYVALEACAFHAYPPPRELVELVAAVIGLDKERRSGVKDRDLFEMAARIKAEANLTGRALANEMKRRGFPIPHKTLASWEKPIGDKDSSWETPRPQPDGVEYGSKRRPPQASPALLRKMQRAADFDYLVRRFRGDED